MQANPGGTLAPLADATVTLSRVMPDGSLTAIGSVATTDAQGRYSFANLPDPASSRFILRAVKGSLSMSVQVPQLIKGADNTQDVTPALYLAKRIAEDWLWCTELYWWDLPGTAVKVIQDAFAAYVTNWSDIPDVSGAGGTTFENYYSTLFNELPSDTTLMNRVAETLMANSLLMEHALGSEWTTVVSDPQGDSPVGPDITKVEMRRSGVNLWEIRYTFKDPVALSDADYIVFDLYESLDEHYATGTHGSGVHINGAIGNSGSCYETYLDGTHQSVTDVVPTISSNTVSFSITAPTLNGFGFLTRFGDGGDVTRPVRIQA